MMKLDKLQSAREALTILLLAYKSENTDSLSTGKSQEISKKTALRSADSGNIKKHVVFSDNLPEIFLPPEARMAAQYLLKLINAFKIENNEALFEKNLRSFFVIRAVCLKTESTNKHPLYPMLAALAESVQRADETIEKILSPKSCSGIEKMAGNMLAEILDKHNQGMDKKIPGFPEANICFYEMAVSQNSIIRLFPYTEKDQNTEYPCFSTKISLLAFSAKTGLEDVATMLIESGFNINKMENLKLPIDIALENGHINIAQLFAQKGAKSTKNIAWATANNKQDVAIFITQQRARVLDTYEDKKNLLHISAELGWVGLAEICLKTANFPIESVDKNGNDALHLSVINNHTEVVKKIMTDDRAVLATTLQIIAANPTTEIALHIFNTMSLRSVIGWVLRNKRPDVAAIRLRKFDGPISRLPKIDDTEFLVYSSITKGWEQVTCTLLDMKITPEELRRAFHIAAIFGNYTVVEKCISMKVDITSLENGKTSLYQAVVGGNDSIIALLIQQPNIDLFSPCTDDNRTIFDIARQRNWTKTEKALADKGYPLNMALLAKELMSLREQLTIKTETIRQHEQEIQKFQAIVATLTTSSMHTSQTESHSSAVETTLSFNNAFNSTVDRGEITPKPKN